MTAKTSADLELLSAFSLLASDPEAAARKAGVILRRVPGHTGASLLRASALRKLGRTRDAITLLERLATERPGNATVHLELGKTYLAGERRVNGLQALLRAVTLDDRLAEGWRDLAEYYGAGGDPVAQDVAYARYRSLIPDSPELKDATAALAGGRTRVAEQLLLRRLSVDPRDVVALRMLAQAATSREDLAEAERRLTQCLEIAAGFSQARFDLAKMLHSQQRYAEALTHIERLLEADRQNVDYLNLKAQTLRFVGRSDEAIAILREMTAGPVADSDTWLRYGHLLRGVGRNAKAIQMYRRALSEAPANGLAYWSLANLKTFRFGRADLTTIEQLLQDPGTPVSNRIALEFSLGKALEDEASFAESFQHYQRGNALHRAQIAYDADAVSADVARAKEILTTKLFADRRGWGDDRPDPIFIVGLPRSGSTLIEQILAQHSQIDATRELAFIPAIATSITVQFLPANAYPAVLEQLTMAQTKQFSAHYLAEVQPLRSTGKTRFVDKMLSNFGHIGLIHLLFPAASIIDVRRHPMASCFACYKQLFVSGMPYTYDLHEMGRYYREYFDLVEHMHGVLPGRIHRIRYESLVADPESEIRALLKYCGLPFEEACLKHYDSPRVVQTISSEQVRKPIYTDAVDQWRNYEAWLTPLATTVGELANAYAGPKSAVGPPDK